MPSPAIRRLLTEAPGDESTAEISTLIEAPSPAEMARYGILPEEQSTPTPSKFHLLKLSGWQLTIAGTPTRRRSRSRSPVKRILEDEDNAYESSIGEISSLLEDAVTPQTVRNFIEGPVLEDEPDLQEEADAAEEILQPDTPTRIPSPSPTENPVFNDFLAEVAQKKV